MYLSVLRVSAWLRTLGWLGQPGRDQIHKAVNTTGPKLAYSRYSPTRHDVPFLSSHALCFVFVPKNTWEASCGPIDRLSCPCGVTAPAIEFFGGHILFFSFASSYFLSDVCSCVCTVRKLLTAGLHGLHVCTCTERFVSQVRWTAPEAMTESRFTHMSDVRTS